MLFFIFESSYDWFCNNIYFVLFYSKDPPYCDSS